MVDRFALAPKIRFGADVVDLAFDGEDGVWNPTETHIRIHAAFTVVNDLVVTPHLRALEHIDLAIRTVCRDLLCND